MQLVNSSTSELMLYLVSINCLDVSFYKTQTAIQTGALLIMR
jgi:hypothetical protein